MKATRRVFNQLKSFEGLKLRRYYDSAGIATIGYGHTELAPKLETITQAEAEALLVYDVARFESLVNSYIKKRGYRLNQNQFDSLVLFTYNIKNGVPAGSGLDAAIRAGNWNQAAEKMLQYNKAGGEVLAGLTKRRQYEARLLVTPYLDAKTLLAFGALFV